MPPLKKENETVLSLFLLVKDQNIMADGNPVALNLAVARAEIERAIKDKNDQNAALNRILAAHRKMIGLIAEQRKEQLEALKRK